MAGNLLILWLMWKIGDVTLFLDLFFFLFFFFHCLFHSGIRLITLKL